ncbi:MAG: FeoA family protein [Kovacikia sp.]
MLTTGFSVQGASLKLLHIGERGMITRINALQDATTHTLRKIGLMPGQMITLEQRFPHFLVRVGNTCHALDESSRNAIYVRIVRE